MNRFIAELNGGDIRLKNVLECLRAQQKLESSLKALESNEPLSLDELRQMTGEPVWFETDTDYEADKGWHICHGEYQDRYIAFDSGDCINFNTFSDGRIVAYRHKPEEKWNGV